MPGPSNVIRPKNEDRAEAGSGMGFFLGNVLLGWGWRSSQAAVRPHRIFNLSHTRLIVTVFLKNQKELLKSWFQLAVLWMKNVSLLETID